MKAIGGYFELELNKFDEFHKDAIKLNTGRNAFEYILIANNYSKIYIPYYTCDVILEPLKKLNIAYEFYNINTDFEPIFDFNKIKETEAFLYTNYFGLKENVVLNLSKQCPRLIIDNAQAFYNKPIKNIDTIYSPRKFFGIADGAYLYSNKKIEQQFTQDKSYNRFEHLLRRLDEDAETGYSYFVNNDKNLCDQPILQMSNLTLQMLKNINYDAIAAIRKENFNYLHQALHTINEVKWNSVNDMVPLVYPFYSENLNLKNELIKNRIYTAQYWPNVLNWVDENSIEYKYCVNLIHLPIDQRISKIELDIIIKIIKS